ncbi:unnamed protein product [Didymodactylos carnosus]|uniref:Uncharacterized protein n=1 Tax=Didymodactylos carnosus TaxID=1234261 RepID=A0A8S2CK31_9BILA|nr:unnamed protein product [Didymodactylos carnosus]CAF3496089.1 unnamed protein product [Didymodactylos carnosus]
MKLRKMKLKSISTLGLLTVGAASVLAACKNEEKDPVADQDTVNAVAAAFLDEGQDSKAITNSADYARLLPQTGSSFDGANYYARLTYVFEKNVTLASVTGNVPVTTYPGTVELTLTFSKNEKTASAKIVFTIEADDQLVVTMFANHFLDEGQQSYATAYANDYTNLLANTPGVTFDGEIRLASVVGNNPVPQTYPQVTILTLHFEKGTAKAEAKINFEIIGDPATEIELNTEANKYDSLIGTASAPLKPSEKGWAIFTKLLEGTPWGEHSSETIHKALYTFLVSQDGPLPIEGHREEDMNTFLNDLHSLLGGTVDQSATTPSAPDNAVFRLAGDRFNEAGVMDLVSARQ